MSETIYDLPYWTAPPLQFVFKQSAILTPGADYIWPLHKEFFTPDIHLVEGALYYFRTVTFDADIAEDDYQAATVIEPVFHLYLQSESLTPQLKNPIALPGYFHNLTYESFYQPSITFGDDFMAPTNHFLATFEGTLQQTANLIGKDAVTLTLIITAQEITDEGYIDSFVKKWRKF